MAYKKVITTTEPPAASIKRVAEISNRSVSYINDEINAGRLNHGYLLDTMAAEPDPISQKPVDENHGQKVVILDEVFDKWLVKKKQRNLTCQ